MHSLTRPALTVLAAAALVAGASAIAATPKASCKAARQTFNDRCSMCHGENGKGYAAIHTPDFTDPHWQAKHTDAQLISAVEHGVQAAGMMPSFQGQLTHAQIDALVRCVVRGFAAKK
ncbi:MAG: c-type cytochrome [Terriglobales bacterium]